MAESSRLRIGLVGAGSHASRNILPTLAYLPVDLISVADSDPERARTTALRYGATPYTSAADMYAAGGIDAVLLCVSPVLHPQLAIQAFQAGLDVWSEKPAATSSDEVRAMLAALGDRICVVGYKKAFMPSVEKVMELLALPEVGPLSNASATYPVDLPLRQEKPFPVTSWLTSGCHPLSLLRAVGGPVVALASHRSEIGGGALILYHADGNVSDFHLSFGASKFQPCERYLFVTDGHSIEIENSRKVIYKSGFDVEYTKDFTFAPAGLESGATVWEAQDTMATMQGKSVVTQGIFGGLAAFVEAAHTRKHPWVGSLEFALDVTKIYEAAQVSNGSIVEIEAN